MKNIYLDFPYINEIEAQIVEKQNIDGKIYFNLDKTIVYYNDNSNTFNDIGFINNKKILNSIIYDDKIWYYIDDNINDNNVTVSIDWKRRYHLMQQYSSICLFKDYIKKIYQINTLNYYIDENFTYLDLDIFYDDLNENLYKINKTLQLCQNFIDSAISLNLKGITVANSSEIRNIEIEKIIKTEQNKIRIYLLSGNKLIKIYNDLYKKKESI